MILEILNHDLFPWFAIAATVLVILALNHKQLRELLLDARTRRCLSNLGLEQLNNLHCPDGLGGEFTIDRVVLHHKGVSIVAFKRYPGKIFCADGIDEWTQMLGNKSYKFKNPLFELDLQVKALQSCLPDVAIDGYLFFDHHAEFPKGSSQRMFQPSTVPAKLQADPDRPLDPFLQQAWNRFSEAHAQ